MTNLAIITAAAIQAGIFSEEQTDAIIKSGHALPLHTFAEWKRMGFMVKKGEKARMKVEIWKKSNKTVAKATMPDGTEEEIESDRFYKKLSHFFTLDQVEKIAKGGAAA